MAHPPAPKVPGAENGRFQGTLACGPAPGPTAAAPEGGGGQGGACCGPATCSTRRPPSSQLPVHQWANSPSLAWLGGVLLSPPPLSPLRSPQLRPPTCLSPGICPLTRQQRSYSQATVYPLHPQSLPSHRVTVPDSLLEIVVVRWFACQSQVWSNATLTTNIQFLFLGLPTVINLKKFSSFSIAIF